MRRLFLKALAACALGAAAAVNAQPTYPNKPVKLVVPFPPGALTDSAARLLASELEKTWGQTVVVENRPGASGNVGTASVLRAQPDGYTLLFTPQQPLVLSAAVNPVLSFDAAALIPLSIVTRSTVLLVANPKLSVNNVPELVAYAKAHPGRLNFASTGNGSTSHLSNELLGRLAGIQVTNVPYQGIAPASMALMAGEVDLLFDSAANALAHVKAGKLKVLAVAGERRSDILPEVATVAETLPGFVSTLWSAVAAPPGTPSPVVQQLSSDIAQALRSPAFVERFSAMPGVELVGGTPDETQRLVTAERDLWAETVKAAGIKFE